MKIMPSDPRIYHASDNELKFIDYWLSKDEDKLFSRIDSMLGLTWSREDLSSNSSIKDKLFLPLSVIIRPDLLDGIKKLFGKVNTAPAESFTSMGDQEKKALYNKLDTWVKD